MYFGNGLVLNLGVNGFSDLGVGIDGFCLGKLMVFLVGVIFEGVVIGLFFIVGILLLLGFFFKGLFMDFMFVFIVKLLIFVMDDVCVFR